MDFYRSCDSNFLLQGKGCNYEAIVYSNVDKSAQYLFCSRIGSLHLISNWVISYYNFSLEQHCRELDKSLTRGYWYTTPNVELGCFFNLKDSYFKRCYIVAFLIYHSYCTLEKWNRSSILYKINLLIIFPVYPASCYSRNSWFLW